jgi:hypothetical protein
LRSRARRYPTDFRPFRAAKHLKIRNAGHQARASTWAFAF